MSRKASDVNNRFMRLVEMIPFHSCWEWLGCKTLGGYGKFNPKAGDYRYSHRFSYEMFVGKIPDGLVIDHLCRNRGCVNPRHLEPVTQRTNFLRGLKWGVNYDPKTHCKKGHLLDVNNIYIYGKYKQCKICTSYRGKLRYYKQRDEPPSQDSLHL